MTDPTRLVDEQTARLSRIAAENARPLDDETINRLRALLFSPAAPTDASADDQGAPLSRLKSGERAA